MIQSAAVLVLATALLASASSSASSPAEADSADSIVVNCRTRALPSQAAVSRLLGIDNFSAAYAARHHLMVEAGRACQRTGASLVRVVLAPAAAVASAHPRPGTRAVTARVARQATP